MDSESAKNELSTQTNKPLKDWQKIKQLRTYLATITPEKFALLEKKEKQTVLSMQDAERKFTYRYDFYAFCIEVLEAESQGNPPSKWSHIHWRICRFMRSCKNLKCNALIQVPRYHLKTQICTVFYRTWRLVHDPELSSLIISGTIELSKATARSIRGILQGSAKLRKMYPNVLPDWVFNDRKNKWAETQFNVAREANDPQCSIEAVGVDATITGKHFGEISMDDLVTDKNSTTPEQCEKIINNYKYFLSIVNPKHGRFIVVGTPYTDSDLYTFLTQPEILATFKFLIQPVYDSLGKPIWPELYSEEKLREIAITQGSYVFSTQYLLDPVPEDQQEFKSEWIQFYNALPRDVNGNEIYISRKIIVDPITAKPVTSTSKDRGVVLSWGVDKTGNIYILDYTLYSRAKESEMFKGIFELSDKHNTEEVGWETVAYQLQGKGNLEEEVKRTGRKLKVTALKPGHTKKDIRIRAMIPYFERGQIYLRPWMHELIQELRRFPHGGTKDIIDSLAYIPQMLKFKRRSQFWKTNMTEQNKARYW